MSWLFSLWLMCSVHAAEPTSPELRVPVGPQAVATTLPRVNPFMVEVRMSYTKRNLASVMSGLRSRNIDSIYPINTGGGDWIIRIVLTKPDLHVDAVVVNGGLDLWVREDEEVMYSRPPLNPAPTIQELLFADSYETFVIPPAMDIRFLYGEAMSYRTTLQDFHSDFGQPTTLPAQVSDDDFQFYRNQYLDVKTCIDLCEEGGVNAPDDDICDVCEEQMGQARYELGWVYLSRRQPHEARFYLEPLSLLPGKLAPLDIALSQAQASLQVGETERVRELLRRAYLYGADEATIIEGVSYLSLETGIPERGTTGRLLANMTARPESVLLAGELLQMNGYFEDSFKLLMPLYQSQAFADKPKLHKRLSIRLGDASIVAGELDAARAFYMEAPNHLRGVRNIHINLLEASKSSSDRVKLLPSLREITLNNRGETKAESMYLAGQIDTALGTRLDAIRVWSEFMRQFPEESSQTDVGARLWALYAERVYILAQGENWVKIVETHEYAWNSTMFPYVMDPEIMLYVAEAYNNIGLPEKALSALYIGFRVALDNELYVPDLVMYLVKLYHQTGRYTDGLAALREINVSMDSSEQLKGEYLYLKAQLNEALAQDYIKDMVPEDDYRYPLRQAKLSGYLDEAKSNYIDASQYLMFKDLANMRLGTLEAEAKRCPEAVDYFDGSINIENAEDAQDYLPYMLYAKCLEELGRSADATAVLQSVQGFLASEEDELRVRYMLSRLLSPNDVELNQEDLDSIWGKLIENDKEQIAFDTEYDRWLKNTK